jgi:hypothetical protein
MGIDYLFTAMFAFIKIASRDHLVNLNQGVSMFVEVNLDQQH